MYKDWFLTEFPVAMARVLPLLCLGADAASGVDKETETVEEVLPPIVEGVTDEKDAGGGGETNSLSF